MVLYLATLATILATLSVTILVTQETTLIWESANHISTFTAAN